jgi:hypothetical protein
MDKELKAKWIAALKSGEYKQGDCKLYREGLDKYCCLGVLAICMGKSKASIANDASSSTPKSWGVLPIDAIDRLIGMNDSHNFSFAEIADHIEESL